MESLQSLPFLKAIKERNYAYLFLYFPMVTFIEEIIFRFLMITFLLYYNIAFSFIILIQGLAFGLYHLHFLRYVNNKELVSFLIVITTLLGFILGYIYLIFGLLYSYIFHVLLAIIIYYLFLSISNK